MHYGVCSLLKAIQRPAIVHVFNNERWIIILLAMLPHLLTFIQANMYTIPYKVRVRLLTIIFRFDFCVDGLLHRWCKTMLWRLYRGGNSCLMYFKKVRIDMTIFDVLYGVRPKSLIIWLSMYNRCLIYTNETDFATAINWSAWKSSFIP